MDNQLSCVTAFSGAPDKWGLLLGTINIRPRRPTCIATFAQRIITTYEDTVDIYDAVTFVLQQSLCTPETVTKIQGSPDGATLFFAHSHSVTMWDIQTGGLSHTFTAQPKITDIAVSETGDCIACGSSDGSVAFWDIHTKEEGEISGDGQPVVTICWLSPLEFAVATQEAVYFHDIAAGETSDYFFTPGCVWGMAYSPLDGGNLLVGVVLPPEMLEGNQQCIFKITASKQGYQRPDFQDCYEISSREKVLSPILVGKKIACITPPRGVLSFSEGTWYPIKPLLLGAATSITVSLNRNLVAQIEDSIQIFSHDILRSGSECNNTHISHVYPLGGKHIICLLTLSRHLALLELETLQELCPSNNTSPLESLPINQSPSARASFSCGIAAELGLSVVMQAWQSGAPLPKSAEAANEDLPLSGLSPDCTRIITFHHSPRQELCVTDTQNGTILANLPLGDDDLEKGEVYDVTFDSETSFHLKVDRQGQHVQIPHDIIIIPSPPKCHRHVITRGEPVPLSVPRVRPSYTLDANCEWVVDAEFRKICWISPGNVRRGNGGHFWAGLSLVMVGDDGVVRKVTFKKPERRGTYNTHVG